MKLKIGDKVKMNKHGFRFYSNLNRTCEAFNKGGSFDFDSFKHAACELFAIHGVGKVIKFNSEGEPFIKWAFRLDGVKYHCSAYYGKEDVDKLSFLDKIKFKLQGRV